MEKGHVSWDDLINIIDNTQDVLSGDILNERFFINECMTIRNSYKRTYSDMVKISYPHTSIESELYANRIKKIKMS
jgi:hypothetical protein